MSLELDSALLAGILAAQIAQLGFEARLIRRTSKMKTDIQHLKRRVFGKEPQ
jgi:hypothetical protein